MSLGWADGCTRIKDYIVRIETPDGFGTGFFFAYNEDRSIVAVATALHVIAEAHDWRRPIRIRRVGTEDEVFLTHEARVVLVDYKRDSAAILIPANAVKVPETMFELFESSKFKRPGTTLMWGGFPGIAMNKLCFFRGSVSAFNQDDDSYYLDGVAINGVSGGPVFDEHFEKAPSKIVGIISAYFVNRQRGETLPGFAVAHDLTHLHKAIEEIKSWDEARKKEAEVRKERGSVGDASTPDRNMAPEAKAAGAS